MAPLSQVARSAGCLGTMEDKANKIDLLPPTSISQKTSTNHKVSRCRVISQPGCVIPSLPLMTRQARVFSLAVERHLVLLFKTVGCVKATTGDRFTRCRNRGSGIMPPTFPSMTAQGQSLY